MKSYKFLLFAFLESIMALSHISCTNPQQRQPNDKQIVNKQKEDTCEVSSKPKLFLDFWGQMSENDFYCISQTLIKSHKLSYDSVQNAVYYLVDKDTLKIIDEYENEKLLKVALYYNPSFPESTVDSSFFNKIKTSLYLKYGKPVKEFFDPMDFVDNSFSYSVRQFSTEWIISNKIIVFTKGISTDFIKDSDKKSHISKHEIKWLSIEYIDKVLNDSITKHDIKHRQEEDDEIHKKLEKL